MLWLSTDSASPKSYAANNYGFVPLLSTELGIVFAAMKRNIADLRC